MNKLRFFQFAFWLLPRVPRRLAQYCAIVVGYGLWLGAPKLRQRVRANLAHIPTLAANPQRLDHTTRVAFAHLLLNYLDLFAPPDRADPNFFTHFPIADEGLIHEILQAGKGCIMISLHNSTLEIAQQRLCHLLNIPIIVPMEALEPPALYDLLAQQRGRKGISFLPVSRSETLRDMLTTLRQGNGVLMAVDRDIVQTGVIMPFFNAPARLPVGVVALARRTGAPIVWVSAWRVGIDRYAGSMVQLPLEIDADTRGDAAVRHALYPIVKRMEAVIMAHPEQWLAVFADDIWAEANH